MALQVDYFPSPKRPHWPWSVRSVGMKLVGYFPTEREAVERAASWERAMAGEVRKVK